MIIDFICIFCATYFLNLQILIKPPEKVTVA